MIGELNSAHSLAQRVRFLEVELSLKEIVSVSGKYNNKGLLYVRSSHLRNLSSTSANKGPRYSAKPFSSLMVSPVSALRKC